MSTVTRYTNYTRVGATETFHPSPRFGHSSDFSNLFSHNKEDQTDYIRGVLFTGIFLFTIFLVWIIVLLIFKCLGSKVGFLSGANMIDPDTKDKKGGCTRPNTVRFVFSLSTVIVLIYAVLLVTQGLTNIKNTTNTLDRSNIKIANIIVQFQGIAQDLIHVGGNANATRAQIVQVIDNFCPNSPNLATLTGVDVIGQGQAAISLLQQLGDFVRAQVEAAKTQLEKAEHSSQQLHRLIDQFNFHALAVSVIVIYIILPTVLLVGVLLAWFGFSNPCIQCMLSWFVLPMWFIMVIFAVLSSVIASWAVVANSDFCSGGKQQTPDDTLKLILDRRNVSAESFLGQVADFYITQCLTADPWVFLRSYQQNLTATNATIGGLADQISDSQAQAALVQLCGKNSTTDLADLLVTMESTLNILITDAIKALRLLSCDSIVPIYTLTVYDTSCHYSVTALAWCFAAFLVIAFFGMIMVTLRSAWHDVVYTNDYEEKNVERDPYQESVGPDEDDDKTPWKGYNATAPVIDYGDGRSNDGDHNEYQNNNTSREEYHDESLGDRDSYQEDGRHHVIYHDEPQVVRKYDDDDYNNSNNNNQKANNGFYKTNVY